MEKNPEIETGNYDFGARMYDSRIGRWWAVDALQGKYPGISPYNFVANNPIIAIDNDGRDYIVVIDMENKTITIKAAIVVSTSEEWPTYNLSEEEILNRVRSAADYIEQHNDVGFVFEDDNDLQLDVKFDIYVLTQGEYENIGKEIIDREYGGLVNQAIITESSNEFLGTTSRYGNKFNIVPNDKFYVSPVYKVNPHPLSNDEDPGSEIRNAEKNVVINGVLNLLENARLSDNPLTEPLNIRITDADIDYILYQTRDLSNPELSKIIINEKRSDMRRYDHIANPKTPPKNVGEGGIYSKDLPQAQPIRNKVEGGEKIKGSVGHKYP